MPMAEGVPRRRLWRCEACGSLRAASQWERREVYWKLQGQLSKSSILPGSSQCGTLWCCFLHSYTILKKSMRTWLTADYCLQIRILGWNTAGGWSWPTFWTLPDTPRSRAWNWSGPDWVRSHSRTRTGPQWSRSQQLLWPALTPIALTRLQMMKTTHHSTSKLALLTVWREEPSPSLFNSLESGLIVISHFSLQLEALSSKKEQNNPRQCLHQTILQFTFSPLPLPTL